MGELAEWAATRTHGRIIVADPRDAFGRIPTSDPITMFDSTHQADKSPLLWEETITGGGAASTHLPNESAVRMRVTANADSVVRQSRAYHRYQPGKSQLVAITFDAGAATANTRQRIGLFDSRNGCFVQRTGTANALVQRSSEHRPVRRDRTLRNHPRPQQGPNFLGPLPMVGRRRRHLRIQHRRRKPRRPQFRPRQPRIHRLRHHNEPAHPIRERRNRNPGRR